MPMEYIYRFHMILITKSDYFPNSINQLIYPEPRYIFFEVRTEVLNNI
jgi:hypothetical protein